MPEEKDKKKRIAALQDQRIAALLDERKKLEFQLREIAQALIALGHSG